MKTNDVCKKLNTTPKALRIYEDYNIVVPKRDRNNYREYSNDDLLKLREVLLLKELGFTLKEIKSLMDKNVYADNHFARSLYLQLKAIEGKINELDNIKNTLRDSIDKMLESDDKLDYDHFLNNIAVIQKENKINRSHWIDRWGFNNKAVKFDELVRDRSRDELGLFEKYDEIFDDVRRRIMEHGAKSLLDIGCGTGNLCGELSSKLDTIGIDQSIEMLLQAKRKYKSMKLKLGNFLDSPFSRERFDIVVTTYAFHALDESEKKRAMSNMLEYLKDNGRIIMVDFMFSNDNEREKCKSKLCDQGKEDLWKVIDNRYYTNVEQLKEYVSSLGCKIHCEHIVNFTWIVEIEKEGYNQ
ncbi:MerR family transcriptional regulator [Wukongibacter baidiensis]|uniref:MerR family transcriptional regulator n=1 Tax=Wukongibacter baidiensis TaxID=1723361 RepID=UPI003D7F754F